MPKSFNYKHKLKKNLDQINKLKLIYKQMTDEELRGATTTFKKRLDGGENLDQILPDAFAAVREAGLRAIGLEHFDVQLIGGMVLHDGNIAEMKTGEGKTLVCTLPAYLNALEGKGVHVVTVNDYLAKRDAEWMGNIFRFLGLTVGCVLTETERSVRKEQYNCDITYITNTELGFDYLRDNMVVNKSDTVQRGLHYCIIDEADSILIDEARTPLIISKMGTKSSDIYRICDLAVKQLKKGERKDLSKIDIISGVSQEESGDFTLDEKDKLASLTEDGTKRIEKILGIENLSDAKNLPYQHGIAQALRANYLMHKDEDYVVKDGEILIVDDFTGRILPGRRFSDGLHQAIEAKEGVNIKQENETLATITFQNFFNKYDKKCGMTGTAFSEKREFKDIYQMDVVRIPTNKPVIRTDEQDVVYKTKKEKYHAVVDAVKEAHEKGQPVLIGTVTIDVSEYLSNLFNKEGIPHQVLNAKYHEQEAEIISHAGEKGAVTIATNMAGRGTDIKIPEECKVLGGLMIIGTERHESRRIDDQLRGRSGRQGDPGTSRFYISLEDDLMRLFGAEKMIKTFEMMGIEDGTPIEHRMLTKSVENAQKKVEGNNFGIRKNLLEFDEVNNEQRELIYEERRSILNSDDVHEKILSMIEPVICRKIDESIDPSTKKADLLTLGQKLTTIIPFRGHFKEDISEMSVPELKKYLTDEGKKLYASVEKIFADKGKSDLFYETEKRAFLAVIDTHWKNHINDLEQMKSGVNMFAIAQKDPKMEYRIQAFDAFKEMLHAVQEDTLNILFRIYPEED